MAVGNADFALLAPVPLEHLIDGILITRARKYVSFGSQKWDLFRQIERERAGRPVPTLIYASQDESRSELKYKVDWLGWYIGSTEDSEEKRQDEHEGHRPPSTYNYRNLGDSAYGWAVFWRVLGLVQVPRDQAHEIRELQSLRTGVARKAGAPRGPERIELPAWWYLPPIS
jgi:hypothetical protein